MVVTCLAASQRFSKSEKEEVTFKWRRECDSMWAPWLVDRERVLEPASIIITIIIIIIILIIIIIIIIMIIIAIRA